MLVTRLARRIGAGPLAGLAGTAPSGEYTSTVPEPVDSTAVSSRRRSALETAVATDRSRARAR
jgi:hypothetical protein